MPAANESQGLKIAVAAFVALTVILAVTSYFLYSNYDRTAAQLAAAQQSEQTAKKAQSDALNQYEELRKRIGSRAEGEFDAVKAEVADRMKKIDEEIAQVGPMVNDAVGKVQAAGGTSPDLEDAKTRAVQIVASYQGEPNRNMISSLDRMKDLMLTLAALDAALARNYVDIRRSLESADRTNAAKLAVAEKATTDAKADLSKEHTDHESQRGDLHTKVDQLQTENNRLATEVANLNTQLRQFQEDSGKKLETAQNIIKELNDYKAQKEVVLDRPDGHVTFVDYNRGEVRTDLVYSTGARPQMTMTIFDRGSPGIPTEKPKATIELTYVGDRYSIARIIKTNDPIAPIRAGDIVYSHSWSPGEPMRYALIGKMDINRDGRDDRQDLIRMIQASGGIVDYDLPPPGSARRRARSPAATPTTSSTRGSRSAAPPGTGTRRARRITRNSSRSTPPRSTRRGPTASDRCPSSGS